MCLLEICDTAISSFLEARKVVFDSSSVELNGIFVDLIAVEHGWLYGRFNPCSETGVPAQQWGVDWLGSRWVTETGNTDGNQDLDVSLTDYSFS